jgi:hypothetical protein
MLRGSKQSAEAKEKIRASAMGHVVSVETREKIRAAHLSGAYRTRRNELRLARIPIGTERIVHGRVEIKVSVSVWRCRAHLVWEETYGPIPIGHMIHHENEDKQDDRLENLRCMTNSEHARYHWYNSERVMREDGVA